MYRYILVLFVVLTSLVPESVLAKDKYFYSSTQCQKLHEMESFRLIEVEEIFQNLLEYSGLRGNYYLCPISSGGLAFATNALSLDGSVSIRGNFIAYDSSFIKKLKRKTGYWGVAGVLAHELAHHILGHTQDGQGSRPDKEIEADYLAGLLMQLSGASLENAIDLPSQPFMAEGGSTHPDGKDRIIAFKQGWYKGCKKSPTPQCQGYNYKKTHVKNDSNYTKGYIQLIRLASRYKGRNVSSKYCNLYVDVSIRQANSNTKYNCGYLVDAYEGSRWTTNRDKQYEWCLKMSAYATEKEAIFREKKLSNCR